MMKYWKMIGIGCAAAGMLALLAGCGGDGNQGPETSPEVSASPEVTETSSPSPQAEVTPTPATATAQPGNSGNAQQGGQEQSEKISAAFIGRADPTTIEIMVDEQVKTAKLDARMQQQLASLALEENQKIELTYEMQNGQMVISDIKK